MIEKTRIKKLTKVKKKTNRKKNTKMVCWKMPIDIIKFLKIFSNKSQALWIIIRESKAFQQWEDKQK